VSNPHAIVPVGAPLNKASSYIAFAGISGTDYVACLEAATCQEVSYANYRGPAFAELDARFGKTITIADKYNLNLFFQGFDLTNRANFGSNLHNIVTNYNTDPSQDTFLKPSDFITPNSTVLPKSFTGEFGARFSF
jgi:hypothetical protein